MEINQPAYCIFSMAVNETVDNVELNEKLRELKTELEEVPIDDEEIVIATGGESYKNTEAYECLKNKDLYKDQLIKLMESIAKKLKIPIKRDDKRTIPDLIMWAHSHWGVIGSILMDDSFV